MSHRQCISGKRWGLNSRQPSGEQQEPERGHSLSGMEEFGQKLKETRSALETVNASVAEMEAFYKLKLRGEGLAEMEKFYKDQLTKARSALRDKEEESQSFKDRVAADLAVSIQTGDTESMNSPVSKIKLTEMYEELRLRQWPKIKDHLKSNNTDLNMVKSMIQKQFNDAAVEMETKRNQIDELFSLTEHSSGPTPQKVKEYRDATIQNLQLALYHSQKEDTVKTPFPEHEGQNTVDVQTCFEHLASKCKWLGCLMALNNPPLQPDWENHNSSMDSWSFFPMNIGALSVRGNRKVSKKAVCGCY